VRIRRFAVLLLLALSVGCATSQQLVDLGMRLGCGDVQETGKIDMKGTGVAGFCELPSGKSALLMSFLSSESRNRFLREGAGWDQSDLSTTLVIVGREWAVAADRLDDVAYVQERLGGEPLGIWRRSPG
jgi:hypothetical protein